MIIGANTIVQFKFRHGTLARFKKIKTENNSIISNFYADKEFRMGSFIVIASPKPDKIKDKNEKETSLETYL